MKHFLVSCYLLANCAYGQKNLLFKPSSIPHPPIDLAIQEWNKKQPGFRSLSSQEQEFYYWVNYSRANPHRFFDSIVTPFVNVYPQLKGDNYQSLCKDLTGTGPLPLFILNANLVRMAKDHAQDIVSHEAMPSHNSTNGETFSDRFKRQDLRTCGGENLSYGNTQSVFLLVLLYLDINVQDLGHRKALLNPNYLETGIGIANYKNGNVFIVEDFACAQQ